MKTVISVARDVQVSMDDYAVIWKSKIFDDTTTIGEIKDWIISASSLKVGREKIGLSGQRISDIDE